MAHVFLREPDLQILRRANGNRRKKLHEEARKLLNYLADQPEEHGPFDVTGTNWPTWKTYIAMHKGAESLVGTGVIAVTGEFIDGTQDSNPTAGARSAWTLSSATLMAGTSASIQV